jgi:hypothetical protein
VGTAAQFALGLVVVAVQAAVFGILAFWVASRPNRVARRIGGVLIAVLGAWPSLVAIINHVTHGSQAGSSLDTNLAVLVSLAAGWVIGQKRRLREAPDKAATVGGDWPNKSGKVE